MVTNTSGYVRLVILDGHGIIDSVLSYFNISIGMSATEMMNVF